MTFTNNATVATRARITGNGAITNELGHGQPRFTMASSIGWANAGWSAKVTVNFSGRFHDGALNNLGLVEDVSPFVITKLNVGYDFGESSGVLEGTSLRLLVNNLFDVAPQTIRRPNTNNPAFNNWTLGREIKIGFSKKF